MVSNHIFSKSNGCLRIKGDISIIALNFIVFYTFFLINRERFGERFCNLAPRLLLSISITMSVLKRNTFCKVEIFKKKWFFEPLCISSLGGSIWILRWAPKFQNLHASSETYYLMKSNDILRVRRQPNSNWISFHIHKL